MGQVQVTKRKDAIYARLVMDPIAVPVARWLSRFEWVTPNRITWTAGIVALASAASFALGELRLGGTLFLLRFFLDCLDGKVARITNRMSSTGAALDLAIDVAGIALNFVALSWYLVGQGVVDLVVVLALLAALMYYSWVLAYRKDLAGKLNRGDGGADTGWSIDVPILRSWIRTSRRLDMSPVPWAIETEVLVLGLLPLVAPRLDWVAAGIWVALLFYLMADVVNTRRVFGLARLADST